MTEAKKIYGLVGYPLGHSFSSGYFNEKFKAEGINAEYVNFEIPSIDDFTRIFAEGVNIQGLNVTIPYKEKVMALLDDVDAVAGKVGAVNVVKIVRDEAGNVAKLRGYNSDIVGFTDSIAPLLKPVHKKALVLGTGGAAKAVIYALRQLGIESTCVSRNPCIGQLAYFDLDEHCINSHKVIVNTTPLGMHPKVNQCPPIPYELLTPEHLCYDLVYNPAVTLFMKNSREYGAVVKNGLDMLIGQAVEAWRIWNEKP